MTDDVRGGAAVQRSKKNNQHIIIKEESRDLKITELKTMLEQGRR